MLHYEKTEGYVAFALVFTADSWMGQYKKKKRRRTSRVSPAAPVDK
jgi:hypothetical protein